MGSSFAIFLFLFFCVFFFFLRMNNKTKTVDSFGFGDFNEFCIFQEHRAVTYTTVTASSCDNFLRNKLEKTK